MVYKSYNLLFTDDSVRKVNLNSIHHVNIKALATELLGIKNHLSNQMTCNIFPNQNILSTIWFFFNTNFSENKKDQKHRTIQNKNARLGTFMVATASLFSIILVK